MISKTNFCDKVGTGNFLTTSGSFVSKTLFLDMTAVLNPKRQSFSKLSPHA